MNVILSGFKEEDANDLVRMHRNAFKEHFNSRIGNFYTKQFIRWFGNNDKAVFVQAKDRKTGKVLGYICGAKEGYGIKMNKNLLPSMLISFGMKPWIVFDKRFIKMFLPKLKIIFSKTVKTNISFPPELKPSFSAVSLAIDPSAPVEYKLSDVLYEEFLIQAKAAGAKSVRGTVMKKNKLALVYYIHNKWSIFNDGNKNKETISIYKKL
jgi:hypothetical protein